MESAYHVRLRARWAASVIVTTVVAACGRVGFEPMGEAPEPGGALAWFPMDELIGGVVFDATGNGRSGSCTGTGCPAVVGGAVAGAHAFDGLDDLVEIPAIPGMQGAFTVMFRIRIDDPTPSFSCPVNQGLRSDENAWQVCVDSGGRVYFQSSGGDQIRSNAAVRDTAWHHVAIRWDGARKTLNVDDEEQSDEATAIEFDDQPIWLGTDIDAGSPAARFTGELDELTIYGRVLDRAELAELGS